MMHISSKKVSRTARVFLASSLLALVAGFPALAAPGAIDAQITHAAAKSHLQKGDTAAAIIALKNAVRDDPANSDARHDLAVLYLTQGNAEGALAELESARTRGYDSAKIMPRLAEAYIALGRHKDVLNKVSTSGLTDTAKAEVLAAQARANLALDDKQAARSAAAEALAIAPDLAAALMASALINMADGKFVEAEAALEKARLAGDRPEYLMLKAEVRQKQRDFDGAVKYLDAAVTAFPESVPARVQRASTNVMRQDMKAVDGDVAWVLERQPKQPLALFLKAYLLAHERKYQESSQILLAMPDLLARYTPAMFLLAETSLHLGRKELALEYAERYLNNAPNDPQGLKLLGRIYQNTGKPDRAVEILEPLVARAPTDSQLKLQLAGALLESGRSQEAIALFQQGLAADPTNADAQMALAVGQLRVGSSDQAVAQIEKTVKASPSSIQANTLLVLTHLQLNQPDKAKAAATAMVSANAADPNAYNLLGTAHLSTNDLSSARTAFQSALQKDAKFVPAALNLARVEERAGNRLAAQEWYKKVVALDAANLNAYQGLANLALRDDNVDQAVAHLKQASVRDSGNLEPRLRLINLLLDRQRYAQALTEARDLAGLAPKSPQAIDALGRTQLASGDVEGGLESYRRLVAQSQDNAEAHRRLGRALMSSSEKGAAPSPRHITEARTAFDQALKLAPEDIAAIADRVDFESRTAGPEAAVAFAARYAGAVPASVPRLIVLGDTQLLAKNTIAATQSYRQAWDKSKTSMTVVRLYAALDQAGKANEALQTIKTWVSSHPLDYDVRFLVANHYLKSGKTVEAIAETEVISAAFPENAALLNNLAWLYSDKDAKRAVELGERAYALAPRSPDVLDTLGWIHVSRADPARGEALLKKAHEIAPERADIGFHYAVALERNNKGNEAKDILTKALAGKSAFSERTQAQALLNKLSTVQ